MSLVSSFPVAGFPTEVDPHSTTMSPESTFETSHLYDFMDLLEQNSVSGVEQIPFLMDEYRRELGKDPYDENELMAVEDMCTRLWNLCTRNSPKHTTSNLYIHAPDLTVDPALYSPHNTIYTPPSTFYNSPVTCYAHPLVPDFGPVVNFGHDNQMYENPQLVHPSLMCANRILDNTAATHRPQCYKELELENDRRQPFKWFEEFLKSWTDEHKYATESDVITFINTNKHYIECLFHALQEVVTVGAEGETTFDLPKWEQVKDSITQPQFYYAAVYTCYTIEKRLRIGPIHRNRAHSRTGDNMPSRVQAVANYYRLCKNSCLRVCLPHFIDEVVDQPEKMKERFQTNCKGNKEKQKRNDAKKIPEAPKPTPVRRKLDQMQPKCSLSSLDTPSRGREKKLSTNPVGGVSKRRQNLPRGVGRPRPSYREIDDEEEFPFIDNEADNSDDQYDGDSIRVVHAPTIDPSLLNIQPGMGNIHQQFQWN